MITTVSLFSGIGGIERGLDGNEFNTTLFCEIDPDARAVLGRHFPQSQIEEDICSLEALPECGLLTAGFPCQDLSQAGKKQGINGSNSGLVSHLFQLIEQEPVHRRPETILIENVPYMLTLNKGQAMRYLVENFERLDYQWAYRVIDARCFGLPQRRARVVFLASRDMHPRDVIFCDNYEELNLDGIPSVIADTVNCYGFYWTEGSRGVGWAASGVPPIKCGSTLGIASPPAVWIPGNGFIGKLTLQHAEVLQGFDVGWTEVPNGHEPSKRNYQWRLIGNAVSCRVSQWVGDKLLNPQEYIGAGAEFNPNRSWPKSAYSDNSRWLSADISKWASQIEQEPLEEVINLEELTPLSARATNGFYNRALSCTNIVYAEEFMNALTAHAQTMDN